MGTSSSYGGPGDRNPLLPPWAMPGGDAGDGGDAEGDGQPGDGGYGDNEGDDDQGDVGDQGGGGQGGGDHGDDGNGQDAAPEGEAPGGPPARAERVPQLWRSAKAQLGRAVSGRTGRKGYAKAGRAYVKALGGAKRAATTSRSARAATGALGRFLSDVRNRGFPGALERLGLGSVVGRDSNVVFAAVLNAICPEGSSREEVATREAVSETLSALFGEFVAKDPTGAGLVEAMTADAIKEAIEASIVAAAFNRWLGDLSRRLEEKAVSAAEAVRLERDIRQYMEDTVHLDLTAVDPLAMNWEANAPTLIDGLYEDAYRMLEGEA